MQLKYTYFIFLLKKNSIYYMILIDKNEKRIDTMKNSIFKSYSKKILKSEAFVSVIIVFVLAIGIISTSYALYMDVDKDTDYQLVQVGDLSIGFDKGDNTIS